MSVLRRWHACVLTLVRAERRLMAITGSIIGSTAVTGGIGLIFWMLAARGLAPGPLGTLGAATAATLFLGGFGTLGLGPFLISELPLTRPERRWELFVVSVVVAFGAGALLAGAFGAAAAATGQTWAPLRVFGPAWWWFVLGTGLTSVAGVLDHSMLVVGNPVAQVWRNTVASTWKVAVLAVALPLSALDVTLGLAAWTTGLLAGTVIAVRAAAGRMPADRRLPVSRVPRLVRRYARPALGHQGVNFALTSSWAAMPALIAWAVTPAENGVFTTVRLVTTQVALLPYALTVSLFVATAGQVEFDAGRSRRTLLTALGISVVLYAGLFLFGHGALLLFGSRYADEGVPYLRVMALSCVLMVFKDQYIAEVRMRRQVGSLVPFVSLSVVVEVAFALVGAHQGRLMGALIGWLLALLLQAGYVAPKLSWRRQGHRNSQAREESRRVGPTGSARQLTGDLG